jgi:adenosylcobyric acid synthase
MAKALMILGTASDVGKSVVTAGLCRIFHRMGIRVAPFKAQNMSLNSNVTSDGKEIGWAQAAQAVACGIPARAEMNPVLLKPNSHVGSQVVLQGKVYRNMGTRSYYASRTYVWKKVLESYRKLAGDFPLIILEGAGSAAEINLRKFDFTNFRMAEYADADVILVGDIERGGVFASLVGTVQLLRPHERQRIKGIIINKFRGDGRLLKSGLDFLERETGIPILGVLPYYESLKLPEEDSVALERKRREEKPFSSRTVNIAVISIPHMANYTDFAELERQKGVTLRYVRKHESLSHVDVVILPGSKNTLSDLAWLHKIGWGKEILSYAQGGGRIIGICGGYQILGEEVTDPLGIEGKLKKGRGLGLLPLRTVLATKKTTEKVVARSLINGDQKSIEGYEIHMGKSRITKGAKPAFKIIQRGTQKVAGFDGSVTSDGRIWGTYLHGVFANPSFRQQWLDELFALKGLGRKVEKGSKIDPYDAWADHLCKHLDMQRIFDLAGTKTPKKPLWTGKRL